MILSSNQILLDVKVELISIYGITCSVSSHSLLVDLCVDVSPCFLMVLKEITNELLVLVSDDIDIE